MNAHHPGQQQPQSATTPAKTSIDTTDLTTITTNNEKEQVILLQQQHPDRSPDEAFEELAAYCREKKISRFDVYGDFHDDDNNNSNRRNHEGDSFLRQFEKTLAQELRMVDAVFMPSGVMAQSISLLIHQAQQQQQQQPRTSEVASRPLPPRSRFACHPTSHLLLHEKEGYQALLHMDPVVVMPQQESSLDAGISGPPLRYADVVAAFEKKTTRSALGNGEDKQQILVRDVIHTLLIELPHRELGGKHTPWDEVEALGAYCHQHGIAFHCDGARLFEASAGYNKTLKELVEPFDSVYVSCYKGLGGLSGAFLLGRSKQFCDQARVWLRRFGGNLYTLAPYAISAKLGYEHYYMCHNFLKERDRILSFAEKRDKLIRLVQMLSQDPFISQVVCFEPSIPQTNMVHGYLKPSVQDCTVALDQAQKQSGGIQVLHRIQVNKQHDIGFLSRFEWNMGQANGMIPDETFIKGWNAFAENLSKFTKEQ